MNTLPVFFAKTIFCGARPPMRKSALVKHESAICFCKEKGQSFGPCV